MYRDEVKLAGEAVLLVYMVIRDGMIIQRNSLLTVRQRDRVTFD